MRSVFPLILGALVTTATQGANSLDAGVRAGAPTPIRVRRAPPEPLLERVEAAPAPGYVWVQGHYSWIAGGWVWVRGAWVMPPRPDALWVESRWEAASQQWTEGYWAFPQPAPSPSEPSRSTSAPSSQRAEPANARGN